MKTNRIIGSILGLALGDTLTGTFGIFDSHKAVETMMKNIDLLKPLIVGCVVLSVLIGHGQTVSASKTYQHQVIFSQRYAPTIGNDGTIYFPGNHALFAINPDGTLKWSYLTDRLVGHGIVIGSDGTLYGDCGGQIVAVTPNPTMIEKSKMHLLGFHPPTIGSDGTLFAANYDGFIYAINPDLSYKEEFVRFDTKYTRFSSLVPEADGSVVFGSQNGSLFAINPDGSLKWSHSVFVPERGNGIGDDAKTYSSPVLGLEGLVLFAGGKDNVLNAINTDGSIEWSYSAGGWLSFAPVIGSDGSAYLGGGVDNNLLIAISPEGNEEWFCVLDGRIFSAPAVSAQGIIYVAYAKTIIQAISPDGNTMWSYDIGDDLVSSPAIGADGTVYILSTIGLHAINQHGKHMWSITPGDVVPRPRNVWYSEDEDGKSQRVRR